MMTFARRYPGYFFCFLSCIISWKVNALNLDLDFIANIKISTCDMTLLGGKSTGGNNYTFTIGNNGKVGAMDIINHLDSASTDFSIGIVNCAPEISKINVSIGGAAVSGMTTALVNSLAGSDGGAKNIGLTIARQTAPDTPFTINSTADDGGLVWTQDEIHSGTVPLIARLISTSDKISAGNFSAIATFNFTYE
ncbi:fimbrial protein [Salmonella enterica]|nr:fimbrial protein [Salmonella enterica]EDR6492103.1 fimbrial protein [Salmonella enterica subsp. diarizonae]HCM1886130.1 fimbrial protein [Salmonella enterica subsp. diarizonae serovar 57:c:z]EEP9805055.1 fimbrial protein [Salmonella enterica subsp. diarizonae]EGV3632749.1 fimbrial protein [Salmonella enterica]